jgi:hypothetical protein
VLLAKQKGSKATAKSDTKHGGDKGKSLSKRRKPKISCWGCGKKGHYQHDCCSLKKKGKMDSAAGGSSTNGSGTTPTNNTTPTKPVGGMLLCLLEHEVTCSAIAEGTVRYYIDTEASSHFINEVDALHDYIPFEVPQAITTAKHGMIHAYSAGTLKFTTVTNGKEVTGEFHSIYYIPNIHTHLISISKLFSQGWEPCLSHNGFTLYDVKGHLIMQVLMKNEVYLVTLQTIYPKLSLSACKIGENETSDELLNSYLVHQHEDPLIVFSTGEEAKTISLFNWHRCMGHHSMKTIVDMANGTVTGMALKHIPDDIPKLDTCHLFTLTKSQHLPFKAGQTHATKPLVLIHSNLVGPMPVESVSQCKYRLFSWMITHRQAGCS